MTITARIARILPAFALPAFALVASAVASGVLTPAPAMAQEHMNLGHGWRSAHEAGFCSVSNLSEDALNGPAVIITANQRENLSGWMIFLSPDFGPFPSDDTMTFRLQFDDGAELTLDGLASDQGDMGRAYIVYVDLEPILAARPGGFRVTVEPESAKSATIDAAKATEAFKELRDCAQKLD